jgi:hypothetical protein
VKQEITVPSDVYVAHHGVGVATRITSGSPEKEPHVYVLLHNGDSGAFHPSGVYRAIATFAGWFYVDRDGALRAIPLRVKVVKPSGAIGLMGPNMQNIPYRRSK